MIHASDAMDYMHNGIDKELSNTRNTLKKLNQGMRKQEQNYKKVVIKWNGQKNK